VPDNVPAAAQPPGCLPRLAEKDREEDREALARQAVTQGHALRYQAERLVHHDDTGTGAAMEDAVAYSVALEGRGKLGVLFEGH
jgi:hypothetical protein